MADVIHKNEDLSELSEAEQLELVMRESKIDALSPEEQVWHRRIQNCYSYLHCKRNITHSKEFVGNKDPVLLLENGPSNSRYLHKSDSSVLSIFIDVFG